MCACGQDVLSSNIQGGCHDFTTNYTMQYYYNNICYVSSVFHLFGISYRCTIKHVILLLEISPTRLENEIILTPHMFGINNGVHVSLEYINVMHGPEIK